MMEEEESPEPTPNGIESASDVAARETLSEARAEQPEPEPSPSVPSVAERLLDPDYKPAWQRALELVTDGKPVDVTEEDLDNLDPAAQAAIYNLRLETLAKTGEAQALRQQMEERQAELDRREQSLMRERTSLHTGIAEALRPYVDSIRPPDGEPPDPDSRAGQEWLIQNQVANYLDQFVQKFADAEGRRQETLRQAEEHAQYKERESEASRFIQEHWDVLQNKTVANEVVRLYQAGYDYQDALDRALAYVSHADTKVAENEAARRRLEAMQRTMRGASREPTIPKLPPDATVEQREAHFRRYPEAREAWVQEALKLPRSLA